VSVPKGYVRATKRQPCPICGRPDWCLIAIDGSKAICPRTEVGAKEQIGEAGYLHELDGSIKPQIERQKPVRQVHINARAIHEQCLSCVTPAQIDVAAGTLGLTVAALNAIGIGYHLSKQAFSFPMYNERARVIGIRLRRESGFKFAVPGSHNGLFLAYDRIPAGRTVHVFEGPTDTAAGIDWGFDGIIGRPSAEACAEMLVKAIAGRETVILANYDEPKKRPDGSVFYPGQRGAEKLADLLVAGGSSVKIVYPCAGHKDWRAWKIAGATRARVDSVIRNARWWARRESA
jgi:hypothetical protein